MEYEDTNDLKLGVVELCELLKKDALLIRVFAYDALNELLRTKCKKVFNDDNFNVYLIENIKVIEQITFDNLRFLDIYGIEDQFISDDFSMMVKHCSFNLGLDNYFEYTELIVEFDQYDDSIKSQLIVQR